jgi:hypothetical protein
MPKPKLHHYVPQFYLRRFSDSLGRLWVWDRDQDRSFQARPDGVAAESHFYYLDDLAERGDDPLAMEKYLSAVEGLGARITGQWLAAVRQRRPRESIEISFEDRNDAAIFIATQYLRTADARWILSACAGVHDGDRHLTLREQRHLHASVLWGDEIFQWIAQKIYDSIWLFARNHTATPFLTSDNPILFRAGDNSMWLKTTLDMPGTYMVYPLAPDVVMYAHPKQPPFQKLDHLDGTISPVTFSEEMADSENTGQAFAASRFVIGCRKQFKSVREFTKTIGTDRYEAHWRERRQRTEKFKLRHYPD